MRIIWGSLAGVMLYLELVYHFSGYGFSRYVPALTIALMLAWTGVETLLVGLVKGRLKKLCYYGFIWIAEIWCCVQLVYLRIFKQPLLWEAVFRGGGDALTNYWREALTGVVSAMPFLLLLLMPGILIGIVMHRTKWVFPKYTVRQFVGTAVIIVSGIAGGVVTLEVGRAVQADYYEDYQEFYDPLSVARSMGVLPMLQRDTVLSLLHVAENSWGVDFEDTDKQKWLADYIQSLEPTKTNEYTGMFEGYNLIFLTAEGFCPYAIREDLTPTLYKLTHSGFVFENYYVPLWQTSTSDGEYINCTGLIPDGQFSMRRSSANNMAYTLPRFFAEEGVYSYAYHNNILSYYDRHVTHSNLGYDFKGCKLGNLSEEEWGSQVFYMEHPDAWPASDLEMIQGTVPEYVNEERFHVYYLTVSGHMNYSFKANAMSYKNREAVSHLEMSENARAYIACNIELDKALENLLAQLEAAGQLEKTVICMSADHYPYAMSTEQYEELAGKSLAGGMDMFRNCLVLWNAGMEEPVYVNKVCGSMDILPTLLNLFGFAYDSGMYAGRDIFSDEEGLVIFNDRSFVTDSVIYNRKEKETIWMADAEGEPLVPTEQRETYFAEKKQDVKNRYQFSAYILQEDYYSKVESVTIPQTQCP